jgi:hypothetical protein
MTMGIFKQKPKMINMIEMIINDRKSERIANCCRRHAGKTFHRPMVLGVSVDISQTIGVDSD